MGTTAAIIAVSYTVVSVLAIGFMLLVVRSTLGRQPAREVDHHRLRENEKTWFAAVVVMLVSLVFATIFFTPYGRSAAKNAQIVDIQGIQFAWLVPSTPIHANRQVEFRLTSKDVSHSFAVYTAGGKLLFQVQVTPGSTQEYFYTFRKPGTYRIVCLELCGVGHDQMQNNLTVTV